MTHGSPGYIPQIDSLRALAVVAVLVYHLSGAWLPGGFAGVDIFFVISGYVVSGALLRNRGLGFKAFLLHFYDKRVLRILPALVACLLVTALATALFIPGSWLSQSNTKTLLLAFAGLSNFSLMSSGDAYFSPRSEFNPATHTWSLGVEEQFYVAFPLIYYLWLRSLDAAPGRRRGGGLLLIAAMAASLAYCIVVSGRDGLMAYYSLASRFWELGLGALLFQAHHGGRYLTGRLLPQPAVIGLSLGLMALALGWSQREAFPMPWALPATLGAALFIDGVVAPASRASRLTRALGWAPLTGIGKISYSLYLWHWPVYVLLRWTVGLDEPRWQALAVALVLGLAIASYRWLERPLRHSRALQSRPPGQLVLGAAATAAVSAGLVLASAFAQPYVSLSTTREQQDWYPYEWALRSVTEDSSGCKSVKEKSALPGGQITTYGRPGCQDVRRLFVLGDSHSTALSTLLSKLSVEQNYEVHVYTRPGCPFLRITEPAADGCKDYAETATAHLHARLRPGDTVLLPSLRVKRFADQWASFSEAEVLASVRGEAAAQRRALGTQEASEWVRPVAERGVRVIFVAPTPLFKAPAFRCSDWFNASNPICRPGLQMEREQLQALRAPVVEAMQGLTRVASGVTVWDPFDRLCPGAVCRASHQGRPLYFDADHLSGYGNLLLYEDFVQLLHQGEERRQAAL
ncbi:acyltransferase [Aquabacterium sp. A7-Y]|uniref:acyltransferase family protein n=1 Tax=Aquabacterium sp. A7-Y TaxID=1349605 RepID=UPI00223DD16C|nr:acyltransferase family protein [Aquabacterium sp. A7-Y]MCW7540222.1 acyltransferase [Aquabacterium sp. A7-Y]